MYKNILAGILLSAISSVSFSANDGKILKMNFSGETFSSHPDVVQLSIEGGYDYGACNNEYAAIRKRDEHLISLALAAYMAGKPVRVWLNTNEVYFPSQNRCVITMLTIQD